MRLATVVEVLTADGFGLGCVHATYRAGNHVVSFFLHVLIVRQIAFLSLEQGDEKPCSQ